MLALILALMAAAPAAPPNMVSGVEVTAQPKGKPPPADLTLQMQGSSDDIDQAAVIWPGAAYQIGIDGHVSLRCLIDVHGLAEACQVVYESPVGKGFGQAALLMRPTIRIAPAMGPDGPISSTKIIALNFKAPDRQVDGAGLYEAQKSNDYSRLTFGAGNALRSRRVTMLPAPVWIQAPGFDDLAQAYPAKGGGEEGYAVNHCAVRRDGLLEGCSSVQEAPAGRGFGKAALSLAGKFRVTPQLAKSPRRDEIWVDVPIRFPSAKELAERTVMAPIWLIGFDPKAAPKVFPPEAVAQGVVTGRGVTRCTVADDGSMADCAPEAGEPDGMGFSEAAAKLASRMKMNLWSADAAPVQGGVVHIPIRLNLKGGG
jgi:hypothetical protein